MWRPCLIMFCVLVPVETTSRNVFMEYGFICLCCQWKFWVCVSAFKNRKSQKSCFRHNTHTQVFLKTLSKAAAAMLVIGWKVPQGFRKFFLFSSFLLIFPSLIPRALEHTEKEKNMLGRQFYNSILKFIFHFSFPLWPSEIHAALFNLEKCVVVLHQLSQNTSFRV